MAATKSSEDADPEDARQVRLSWHEKRREVREKSTKGKYFRSSLQCLDNNEILLLLESIAQRSKQGTQTANSSVQLEVWEQYKNIWCMDMDTYIG